MNNLAALIGRSECGESLGNFGGRDAVIHRDRCRRENVIDIVLAEQRAVYGLTHAIADEVEARAFSSDGLDVFGADISDGIEAEEYDLAFEIAAELADILVIGVEERGAGGGEGLDQLVLCACDAGDGIEVFEMHGSDVGDEALVGARDAGEGGNFASVVHPHFDDGKIVFRFEREQAERETEVIVEVALGAVDAVFGGQQVRDGLFRGGLAHRTGDADGGFSPQFSDSGGEGLERDESVVDGEQVFGIGVARELIFADYGCERAAGEGGLNEVVTVEALAFYGKEEIAGLDGARIDGICVGDAARVVVAGGRNEFGDAREREFHAGVSARLGLFAAHS